MQTKFNSYKKLAIKDQALTKRMNIINEAEYLKDLSEFDRYEIAMSSKIEIILK